MTQRLNPASWRPIFEDICHVLNTHKVPLDLGEAIFAYGLGYARGLQQRPVMDMLTVQNIHTGWVDGASTEAADLITTEEGKS